MPGSYEGPSRPDQGSDSSRHIGRLGRSRAGLLPPWKVVLCHDALNDEADVIEAVLAMTSLNPREVKQRVEEAATTGESLLLTTHRERAELYERQLGKRNLHVIIAPA